MATLRCKVLCLVVTGPFLNSVWTSSYRESKLQFPQFNSPVEQLRAGAEWAVDVAMHRPILFRSASVPSPPTLSSLSSSGGAPYSRMVVTCVLFVVVLFTVTLYVSHRRMLTAEDRTFRNLLFAARLAGNIA